MKVPPPLSSAQLMERASLLAGKTLQVLAHQMGEKAPSSLLHAKGWTGQLLEKILGANAMSLDQPDFIDLGIELKTLPVNTLGQPYESTYICAIPIPLLENNFESSRLWRKMAKILWVPIDADKNKPIGERTIGTPFLWTPSAQITLQLKQDWEELTELIKFGQFENLSAHKGKYLQIRPKAPNSKTFIQVTNHEGELISIVPKGFYLRASFTQSIVQEFFSL